MYSLMRVERKIKKKWIFHVLVALTYIVLLGTVIFLGIMLIPDEKKNKEIAKAVREYVLSGSRLELRPSSSFQNRLTMKKCVL